MFFLNRGPREGVYALRNLRDKLPATHRLRTYLTGDSFESMKPQLAAIADLADLYETLKRR